MQRISFKAVRILEFLAEQNLSLKVGCYLLSILFSPIKASWDGFIVV